MFVWSEQKWAKPVDFLSTTKAQPKQTRNENHTIQLLNTQNPVKARLIFRCPYISWFEVVSGHKCLDLLISLYWKYSEKRLDVNICISSADCGTGNNPIWQKWGECQWDEERVFHLKPNIILSCSLDSFRLPAPSACLQTTFPFSASSPSAWPGPRAPSGKCSWVGFSYPTRILLPPSPFERHSPLLKAGPQTGPWATKESIQKLCA